MSNRLAIILGGLTTAILIVLFSTAYTVSEIEQKLIVQFGNPKYLVNEPGLHFKFPWRDQVAFDKRVLNYDADAQEVPTEDQKQLLVDAFARYRITDPLRFYQTVRNENGVRARLARVLNSHLRGELGKVPLGRVLTEARSKIMMDITNLVNADAQDFGIEVIDVRMKRVDLPKENSLAIFRRMGTQREQEARRIRAEGERDARIIRAEADKQSRVIVAEAKRQARVLRGEGEAEAEGIYRNAYSRDAQFFNFYRSMDAMRIALDNEKTSYVGPPSMNFFKLFEGSENVLPTSDN